MGDKDKIVLLFMKQSILDIYAQSRILSEKIIPFLTGSPCLMTPISFMTRPFFMLRGVNFF